MPESDEEYMARLVPDPAGPCRHCPWLTTNHRRRHPDGWFTKANRARLWAKLRTGDSMSCHPTDPNNPVSERAVAAGYRPAPATARTRECMGALILQQREFMVWQDVHGGDHAAYRKGRPGALTLGALARIAQRFLFGGVPTGPAAMPKPNLNAPVNRDGVTWKVLQDEQ